MESRPPSSPANPDLNLDEKLKPKKLDVNLEDVENEARVQECENFKQLYGVLDKFQLIPMGSTLIPAGELEAIIEDVCKGVEVVKNAKGFDPLQENSRRRIKEVLTKTPRIWKIRQTVASLLGVGYVIDSDK